MDLLFVNESNICSVQNARLAAFYVASDDEVTADSDAKLCRSKLPRVKDWEQQRRRRYRRCQEHRPRRHRTVPCVAATAGGGHW